MIIPDDGQWHEVVPMYCSKDEGEILIEAGAVRAQVCPTGETPVEADAHLLEADGVRGWLVPEWLTGALKVKAVGGDATITISGGAN